MSRNVAEWIEHWANHGPERIALHFEGHDITYGEFAKLVQNLARKLAHNLLVRPGDRVAYLGHNHPFYLVVYFACAKIGAIIVPLNFRLALHEHAEQLRLSQPRALFVTSDFFQHTVEIDRRTGQIDGPALIVIKT